MRRPFHLEWAMLLLITLAGAALRLHRIGELPPGLYQDEGYNGLDALDVIQGAHPIYFSANNGREPLFIYLQSLSVAVFGRTAFALRLPAASLGILLIPATYGLGRALFGGRVGMLSAAITAGNWWVLALSRIGLRAGALPLVIALSLTCTAMGWRAQNARRVWLIAAGGALYGLSFYTYLSARFTPLALFAFLIFWYIARRSTFPSTRRLMAFVAPAVAVIAPLGMYALAHPSIVFGRAEQVSILSPDVNGGDLWGTLFHNSLAALGMFVWRGDPNARHNIPGLPVFDPFMGAAFVAGVWLCLWRACPVRAARPGPPPHRDAARGRDGGRPHDPGAMLAALWSAVMLAPTVLSKDVPHYLRAAGVLPIIYLMPAFALDAGWRFALPWALNRAIVVAVVVASLGLTARDYFGRYVRDPNTAYYYQSAAVDLAAQVNRDVVRDDRTLYLDRRLWDTFAQLRFLVPERSALNVFGPGETPGPAPTAETEIIVWPYEDARAALVALPPRSLIRAQAGPPYRGDLEPEPYSLYTTYLASPACPEACGAPLAEFEGGSLLQAASVAATATGIEVALVWVAQPDTWQPGVADYHVFVHLWDGATVIAQADGPPANGLYPTSWWRAGDAVADTHSMTVPVETSRSGLVVRVGLYAYPSGPRATLRDGTADYVELPVP